MPTSNEKFLVGLVGPKVLEAIEQDSLNPVFLDLQACNALEIRYDFFDTALWPKLSERLRKVAPHAIQIGTIRLHRDGGKFPDRDVTVRPDLWKGILGATEVPEWLDLERDCLLQFADLKKEASARGTRILVSEHNFVRIPGDQELKILVDDARRVKADGLKIAAMSNSETDCDRLYKFAKKYSKHFDLFAAFGMGDTGRTSRLWSLKEGANLTYAAIDAVEAPGQIDVMTMKKALDSFDTIYSQSDLTAFLSKFRQF